MKVYLLGFLLLFSATCGAQEWFAEVSAGMATYNGDLTQKEFSVKRVGPSATFNLKYNTGDFLNIRAGLSYAMLSGNDNNNSDPGLRSRNLNFKTSVVELNVCVEVTVLDPQTYYSYPYIFAGVGVFHFNPYTTDNNGQKTYLQPLGTEGQGLPEYPGRNKYSLFQPCFPFGGGFKLILKHRYELGFEVGYRILTTDYLDDVSKTYVNLKLLEEVNGPKARELSYRGDMPFQYEGEKRGNNKVRDSYLFAGIKFATKLGFKKKERQKAKANEDH